MPSTGTTGVEPDFQNTSVKNPDCQVHELRKTIEGTVQTGQRMGIAVLGCAGVCVVTCLLKSLLERFVYDEAVTSEMIFSDSSFKG